MALFGVGRGRARDKEAVPGPGVLAPRRSLDGWTLEGTALAARFPREVLRELATLMHGVSAGMETPWTYERAADMLERGGERPQALAVLDAYFTLPAHIRDANAVQTRTLGRRRQRLRKRLGTPPPAGTAADALTDLPADQPQAIEAAAEPRALERGSVAVAALPAGPSATREPAALEAAALETAALETAGRQSSAAASEGAPPMAIPPRPTELPPKPKEAPPVPATAGTAVPPKPTTAPPAPIPPRPTRSALPTPPPEARR